MVLLRSKMILTMFNQTIMLKMPKLLRTNSTIWQHCLCLTRQLNLSQHQKVCSKLSRHRSLLLQLHPLPLSTQWEATCQRDAPVTSILQELLRLATIAPKERQLKRAWTTVSQGWPRERKPRQLMSPCPRLKKLRKWKKKTTFLTETNPLTTSRFKS